MYICLDCGEIFEEPEIWEEAYPYGEGCAYQRFSCCPYCEGSYEEAEMCKDCGEYFAPDDLYDEMCNKCRESIRKEVATLIAKHFPKSYFDNFPDDTFDNIWEDIENAYTKKGDK